MFFALAALLLAAAPAARAQTYIASCGGSMNLTKFVVQPVNPQAGDTVILNATGTETGATLSGGAGVINAYLFGLPVFNAPFTVRPTPLHAEAALFIRSPLTLFTAPRNRADVQPVRH